MSDEQEETGDIFAEFYSMVSHLPNFHHHVQNFVFVRSSPSNFVIGNPEKLYFYKSMGPEIELIFSANLKTSCPCHTQIEPSSGLEGWWTMVKECYYEQEETGDIFAEF